MTFAGHLPEARLDAFTRDQTRFAIAAWPMRAAEELRSALIFRALTRAAGETGTASAWVPRFASAVMDEVGHAKLCAEVGARLGAATPHYDAAPVRARLAGLRDPTHRMMSLLLVEVAIGETISTELFKAGRQAATEPLTHAALSAILRDEVRHSQLGWTGVTALFPTLTEAQRDTLEHEITHSFGAFERQIAVPALRRLDAGEPFDPAYAKLGVLPPEVRVDAFYAAVEGLVIPRLTRLGLDGARAWKHRYVR